jgi:Asp-tRNA(Asn)/Glu-tRNA(Gln) amidotransferase A subunit family amidase
MVATTLPWPRSLLPLRGAAAAAAVAARGYHRSIESRTFAVAASSSMASSGGEDDAIELARKIRARAPSACWSSDETPAVLAPPPPPANSSSSSSSLPLSGLTFASKEMYDVAGQEPAFGSPAYRRWRQKKASSTSCSTSSYTSTTTAPAVAALVAAGATLVGRTTMSEIAYALTGDHTFYPVPPNPAFEVDE